MAILKLEGLVHGHYECRSLDDTLPIFSDLLAAEVVDRRDGTAVVKHPNTGWLLVVHEGGPDAPSVYIVTSDRHARGHPALRAQRRAARWSEI